MRLYDIKNSELKEKVNMRIKNRTVYEIVNVSVIHRSAVCDVINKNNNDPRISTVLKIIYVMDENPAYFFASLKS